jgi:hypothetical protein
MRTIIEFVGFLCGMFFAALLTLGLTSAIIYGLIHLFTQSSTWEFIGVCVAAVFLLLIMKIQNS